MIEVAVGLIEKDLRVFGYPCSLVVRLVEYCLEVFEASLDILAAVLDIRLGVMVLVYTPARSSKATELRHTAMQCAKRKGQLELVLQPMLDLFQRTGRPFLVDLLHDR